MRSKLPMGKSFLSLAIPFPLILVLFGMGGGILGLGSVTLNAANALSYLSDDPKACANCHVMRDVYDGWNHGSHKDVAVCNDCHIPHSSVVAKYAIKAFDGLKHSVAFTLDRIPDPIRIEPFDREITYENCLTCHAEMISFISHVDDSAPTDCLTCHAGVGHGR